ncbi:MAG: hypothetical protein JWM11_380, partial [Planctomycetaceae bacterium]|nr:hypothetical protein [Planctomycetaceae bacterium]
MLFLISTPKGVAYQSPGFATYPWLTLGAGLLRSRTLKGFHNPASHCGTLSGYDDSILDIPRVRHDDMANP